jgi:hypothetical protein
MKIREREAPWSDLDFRDFDGSRVLSDNNECHLITICSRQQVSWCSCC